MAITIADVAELAGVSAGTVSRVLNGAPNVRPDTRARVQQAIAELDFQPNLQARSLRSKRTNTIALVIPELTNHYWTAVATGVQHSAQTQGYHLILTNSVSPHNDHLHYLGQMLTRVDGVILTRRSERGMLNAERHLAAESTSIPAVFIGQSQASRWQVDSVYSDSISGSYALTDHLIRLGHRHIAMVSGRETSSSASERVAGYCMALANAQIPIDARLICWGEYQREAAAQFTCQLMERAAETSAIVAANNEIAIGVMCALEALGRRVPQDVAVVCFEDFYPDSRFASIMTCVDTLPYDIGVNAAQMLLHRINSDDHLRPRSVMLPTRLIVRESCGGGQVEPFAIDRRMDSVLGQLVPSLPAQRLAELMPKVAPFIQPDRPALDMPIKRPDRFLIKQMLQRTTPAENRILRCDYAISNKRLFRYVLEREPLLESIEGASQITAEDQVELAYRTGATAALCRFPMQRWSDKANRQSHFAALLASIDYCDRYAQAARNASIGLAIELGPLVIPDQEQPSLPGEDDDALHLQVKLAQMLCDRFSDDLIFALVTVEPANGQLPLYDEAALQAFLQERLSRLLQPAREHHLPTVVYLPGKLDSALPLLHAWGIDAVYPAHPELSDLVRLKLEWQGRLTIMGGIPVSLLAISATQQINDLCSKLAAGGWIGGVSGEINHHVPYESFLAFLRAMHELRPIR